MSSTDTEVDDDDAESELPVLVWSVARPAWDQEDLLIVLPRKTFEHWMERLKVFSCSTWGELRQSVTREVYEEVCELCGYGSFEGFTQHLAIKGAAPLAGVYERAAADYDPDEVPPADGEPFSIAEIGAFSDGDWPPAVPYLMSEELPPEILDDYAERAMTTLNGEYATISADQKEAVLRDLSAAGYRLFEEPRLSTLLNCRC